MIPTMLLAGLLVGRGWAVPVGALAWGVLLLVTGTIGLADLPLAVLLGGLNTTLGVIVRCALAWPLRRARALR